MIVSRAYEYLDKKEALYRKYRSNKSYLLHTDINNIKNDLDLLPFTIDDDKKNIIMSGNTSIIGYYNPNISTWYWAWSVPFPNKAENYLSRKILNYAFDIDIYKPQEDYIQNSIFKAELLNSKIYMTNSAIEIEKYIALSMYLTKSDYYWKVPITSFNITDNVEEIIGEIYYLLRNVKIESA